MHIQWYMKGLNDDAWRPDSTTATSLDPGKRIVPWFKWARNSVGVLILINQNYLYFEVGRRAWLSQLKQFFLPFFFLPSRVGYPECLLRETIRKWIKNSFNSPFPLLHSFGAIIALMKLLESYTVFLSLPPYWTFLVRNIFLILAEIANCFWPQQTSKLALHKFGIFEKETTDFLKNPMQTCQHTHTNRLWEFSF